jgi:hypothetical protein
MYMGLKGEEWTNVAQDRSNWRALVHEVVKFQVPRNGENYLTSSTKALLHTVREFVSLQDHSSSVEKGYAF